MSHTCSVCYRHVFPTIDSFKICPYCGWEDCYAAEVAPNVPQSPNHISLSKYKKIYQRIHQEFPCYKWENDPVRFDMNCSYTEQPTGESEDYTSCEKITCRLASFPRQTLNIIASRPANGEEGFLLDIINCALQNRRIDFFDLYNDEFNMFYNNHFSSESFTAHSVISNADGLYAELEKIDNPDIIILRGIQAIQKAPFSPFEMHTIINKLRKIAQERNATIIVYSGLRRDCNGHPLTIDDVHRIGINEAETDFIVALKNNRAKTIKDY